MLQIQDVSRIPGYLRQSSGIWRIRLQARQQRFGILYVEIRPMERVGLQIEQGGNDRMFNSVRLSSLKERVLFGGGATIRIDGIYYV